MAHPYKGRPVGKTTDWWTPPWILKPLGHFDLDPCVSLSWPWITAATMWTIKEDGLATPWPKKKGWPCRVWCNPPYGRETSSWLEKMGLHGNGIALVFARTETRMFFDHVWPKASAVLFLKGRPKFCDNKGVPAKGNSGGPLVLIAYGENNVPILKNSGIAGQFIKLGCPHA